MPRGDRSGPDGRGPRGGVCVGAGQVDGRGRSLGLGYGYGFGGGRGRFGCRGRGFGMDFGRGYAGAYSGAYPVNQLTEQEALESRAAELERELTILKDRLAKNSEKSEN